MTEIKKTQKTETVTLMAKPETMKRKLKGVVVSNKMAKTIVVVVERVKFHQKYRKHYKVSKKYKVHDESGRFKVGDKVEFVQCRPMSKDKCWLAIYSKK